LLRRHRAVRRLARDGVGPRVLRRRAHPVRHRHAVRPGQGARLHPPYDRRHGEDARERRRAGGHLRGQRPPAAAPATRAMSRQLYDTIGRGYDAYRRPDPRLAAAIAAALGAAASVVNVGAGAGSYEPADRPVVAVEPSAGMLRQRRPGAAPAVQASATDLPFRDATFGAALAVLTVHHWPDRARGLAELGRVARERIVVLTWDPAATSGFWLVDDYFPEMVAIDREIFPTLEELRRSLGPVDARPLLVPHDCVDGFLGAYWRRPEAYLDAGVRGAISTFTKLADVESGLARLRADLADGTWERRRDARDDPVREILGGEPRLDRIADRRLMRYLRTIGDAGIGAQTVREQPTLILSPQEPGDERAPELYAFRVARGLSHHPRNVIYSLYGRVPSQHPMLTTPGLSTIILTTPAGRSELTRRGIREPAVIVEALLEP